MEYHHLNPRDLLYFYEFNNMIKELEKGLDSIENKTEQICKKISAIEFLEDYDNLNNAGKALIVCMKDTPYSGFLNIHNEFMKVHKYWNYLKWAVENYVF